MTIPSKWHVRPVWSESLLCAHWVTKDPSFHHTDSENSDETGRMSKCFWCLLLKSKKKEIKSFLKGKGLHPLCLVCRAQLFKASLALFFFAEKNVSIFYKWKTCSNISVYAIFNDQSFNDTPTNDIISFEQLGPGKQMSTIVAHFVMSSSAVHCLNLEGHWGATDDVATSLFHLSLSYAAMRDSPNPKPVQSFLLPFSPSCSLHCSHQNCLRYARGFWDVVIPYEFPHPHHGLEIVICRLHTHYENMPMQICRKFYFQKLKNFR